MYHENNRGSAYSTQNPQNPKLAFCVKINQISLNLIRYKNHQLVTLLAGLYKEFVMTGDI